MGSAIVDTIAAVARERPDLEVLVNISQITITQMSLTEMTDSPPAAAAVACKQVLKWSGLPVVNVRPTVFLQHPFFSEWAAESIARDSTIRLPFGTGRTSPIDARDVAEVGESNHSHWQGLRTDRAISE